MEIIRRVDLISPSVIFEVFIASWNSSASEFPAPRTSPNKNNLWFPIDHKKSSHIYSKLAFALADRKYVNLFPKLTIWSLGIFKWISLNICLAMKLELWFLRFQNDWVPAPDLVLATENRLFRIIGNFLVQNLKVISNKLILFDIFIQIALIDIFVFKVLPLHLINSPYCPF